MATEPMTAEQMATEPVATGDDGWNDTTIDAAEAASRPETAEAVRAIEALRKSIDNVDAAIVALLAERFACTAQVGVLKAQAGFAPEDRRRERYQEERLRRLADEAGLDPQIAEQYHRFVVTEAKRRHRRIAEQNAGAVVATDAVAADAAAADAADAGAAVGNPAAAGNVM